MELREVVDNASAFVAAAAALGLVLLVPLYFSQRRDIGRLRAWMESDPGHPEADLRASEAILDRAESELEELLAEPSRPGDTVVQPPGAPQERPGGPARRTPATLSPLERVTGERPALERITMERAALEPHPGWRRFAARATQPRVLAAIAAIAVLVGVAAIFGSEQLLRGGEKEGTGGTFDPSEVTVAVLNGTSVNGLAGTVSSDVVANGFRKGVVTNTDPGTKRTTVMFPPGEKRAANKVAKTLGAGPPEPIDRDARRRAAGADVVVIAGEDRAR